MICPKCKELNQKSTITGGSGYSTAMGWQPYYDEEGRHHNHDPNGRTSHYSCSQGHDIIVSWSNKCPYCDFGHETVTTVKDAQRSTTTSIRVNENGAVVGFTSKTGE